MSATALRRIVPRFSLRTLSLFMLVVTADFALWFRADPWVLEAEWHALYGWGEHLAVDAAEGVIHIADGPCYHDRHGKLWGHEIPYDPETEPPPERINPLQQRWTYDLYTGEFLGSCLEAFDRARPARPKGAAYASRPSNGTRRLMYRPALQTDPRNAVISLEDSKTDRVLSTFRVRKDSLFTRPPGAALSSDGNVLAATGFSMVRVWRRIRPEWWWGVAWLWEFWFAMALSAVFVWSLVSDHKALASPARRPAAVPAGA